MKKRMFALGLAILLVVGLSGCGGDKIDPEEQKEAEFLVNGLNMMAMMTDVNEFSSLSTSPGFTAPPFWEGPGLYPVPEEWEGQVFYKWLLLRFPVDSLGTVIDSASLYLMFNPDVWDTLYQDSIPTGLEIGILGDNRDIWFYTFVNIPDTLTVDGAFTWNWEETWYEYAYNVSQLTESAEIDISTSNNIGLSAQFRFDDEGFGSTDDNFARWQNVRFVRYEFFPEPEDGYDGYYELLSESWKVKHYFKLVKYEA